MLPRLRFESAPPGALHGLRVLDLSRLVAGNMLSLQLADHGAEVVKVEDPRTGDPLRAWRVEGYSLWWKTYARGKKSLALSLRHEEGRALLLDLARAAHVFMESFRPGTLEAMGRGPEVLLAANPRLVILRISGFGQDGPYRDRPGFGTLVEAMSGYASRSGEAGGPPLLPPTALADMVAGLYGAFAVMAALRVVEGGGPGQVIDLPLLDPLASLLGAEAETYRLTGQVPPRQGSRSHTTAPRNVFRAADGGYIALAASIQPMCERLFRAIGRPDMIKDPRFRTNTDRLRHVEECEAPIAAFIAARGVAENMALFEAAEVTAAPVHDIAGFLADPHVQARGIAAEWPDPELGAMTMHGVVPRLSATPGAVRAPAPRLGEHTREVLEGLGLDAARLAALEAAGAIKAG